MDKNDLINRYKCGERDFVWVNLSCTDLSYANLSGANFRKADLSDANLGRANLGHANLRGVNLRGTALWYANLWNADLSFADLSYADLSFADLSYAVLSDADLSFADLSYIVLRKANLSEANLRRANLSGADLSRTNLNRTKFGDTNLRGTVLDPENTFDPLSEEEFLSAGFEVDGGRMVGYRTKMSMVCVDTIYISGKTYTAPVFSTDTETECHPGIYLAPLSWMQREYKGWSLVKVSAAIPDVLRCGDKWRAREIFVIEDCEEKENGWK